MHYNGCVVQTTANAPPKYVRMWISLSDPAFEILVKQAEHFDYIRHTKGMPKQLHRSRGLVQYVAAVLRANSNPQDWMDHRPDWMLHASEFRIDPSHDVERRRARRANGLHHNTVHCLPLWWSTDETAYRRSRLMTAGVIPLGTLSVIAHHYGISNPRYYDFESESNKMLGNFLEVWGQKHLLPAYDPPKAKRLHAQRPATPREFTW